VEHFVSKFKAVKTQDGEKLYMKWILSKDVKEIDNVYPKTYQRTATPLII
jgi:hypothetical protein